MDWAFGVDTADCDGMPMTADISIAEYNAKADLAMSEKELQSNVIELARRLGYLCYHTFDSRHSAAGFPDLTMVRANRLIFVELKREKGQLTTAQHEWRERLREVGLENWGLEYYIWRPSDWTKGAVEEVLL